MYYETNAQTLHDGSSRNFFLKIQKYKTKKITSEIDIGTYRLAFLTNCTGKKIKPILSGYLIQIYHRCTESSIQNACQLHIVTATKKRYKIIK